MAYAPVKPLSEVTHIPCADTPLRDELDPWQRTSLLQRPPSSNPGGTGSWVPLQFIFAVVSHGDVSSTDLHNLLEGVKTKELL